MQKKTPPYHPPTPVSENQKLNKQIYTSYGSSHTCTGFFNNKMSVHFPFIKFQLSSIPAQPYPPKILILTSLN